MNLTNKLSFFDLADKNNNFKKIFLFRVCGVGMGNVALLLLEKGFCVEGGDRIFYPPMDIHLKQNGIILHNLDSIDISKLKEFDLIIVGNAVKKDSDDSKLIENSGVAFCSFPAFIGATILNDTNVIGISGTHGKTTTTYFFAQIFEKLGFNPGYFIGGVIDDRASVKLGDGKYFFIESDEYDTCYYEKVPKFLFYSIDHLIITSLEYDHADIYSNVEQITNQFNALIKGINKTVIVNSDYQEVDKLYHSRDLEWISYSLNKGKGPFIKIMNSEKTVFTLILNSNEEEFTTNVIGVHNILNLSSVIIYAFNEVKDIDKIRNAVLNIKLLKRRQEEKGYYGDALVIDDFAHHPRAIKYVIDTIRIKYPNKKVTAIMEPHSATSRSSIFQKEFSDALSGANKVIITKPTKPNVVKHSSDLDLHQLSSSVVDKKDFHIVDDLKSLLSLMDQSNSANDIILVLGNGNCLGLWNSNVFKPI